MRAFPWGIPAAGFAAGLLQGGGAPGAWAVLGSVSGLTLAHAGARSLPLLALFAAGGLFHGLLARGPVPEPLDDRERLFRGVVAAPAWAAEGARFVIRGAGEDILVPVGKSGKRGKIGFALRFHLGRGVEVQLSPDKRGASLLLPDGRLWQFRLGGDRGGTGGITCLPRTACGSTATAGPMPPSSW